MNDLLQIKTFFAKTGITVNYTSYINVADVIPIQNPFVRKDVKIIITN